jgi:hypothetical protein
VRQSAALFVYSRTAAACEQSCCCCCYPLLLPLLLLLLPLLLLLLQCASWQCCLLCSWAERLGSMRARRLLGLCGVQSLMNRHVTSGQIVHRVMTGSCAPLPFTLTAMVFMHAAAPCLPLTRDVSGPVPQLNTQIGCQGYVCCCCCCHHRAVYQQGWLACWVLPTGPCQRQPAPSLGRCAATVCYHHGQVDAAVCSCTDSCTVADCAVCVICINLRPSSLS